MRAYRAVLALLMAVSSVAQTASTPAEPLRPKGVRNLAKEGTGALPKLQQLVHDPNLNVRLEAVKAIVEIGTPQSLDPLLQAILDNDPEVQIRAADGLVNFYLPGYVRTGLGAPLRRASSSIKSKFTDTNDRTIEPYVQVRPEVIQALGKLTRGGASMDARANAARALGVLRGAAAIPDLLETVHSKDTNLIYESLVALQKIGDRSVAPQVHFLLRDLDPKVQIAAIETAGVLVDRPAVPDLLDVLNHARNTKIERAALSAMAMLPDEKSRETYARYLASKDEGLRAAAAEGYGRLKNSADRPMLEKAMEQETRNLPRISLAFALVLTGNIELSESSPLQYLINALNSASYHDVAYAFLTETAREPDVRGALYQAVPNATKDEKIYLARVLARSGDQAAVPYLEKLSRDGNQEVAQEGLRALRTLKARL